MLCWARFGRAGRAGLGWAWGLALVGGFGCPCMDYIVHVSSCLHDVFVFIFMYISDVYHGA